MRRDRTLRAVGVVLSRSRLGVVGMLDRGVEGDDGDGSGGGGSLGR
jgi:hypothetical protein